MEVIVVATHNERYFDSFIDSMYKYNIKPTILGWNQKYTGHLMKDNLLEDYLSKNTKKRIILFCDAFDCILVRNPTELINQFIESKHKMVISNELTSHNRIYNAFQKTFFGTVNNQLINTGMIMGYSDTFLECLQLIKNYRIEGINSNQKIWSNALSKNEYLKNIVHIDDKNEYFHNHNILTTKLIFKNNMVYIPLKKSYPFMIQGNGNNDLNYINRKLNIRTSQIKEEHKLKYYSNFIYYYILPYKYYILSFILLIVIISLIITNRNKIQKSMKNSPKKSIRKSIRK